MWLRDWQFLGFHPGTYTKIVDSKLTKAEARKREANLINVCRKKGCLLFNDCPENPKLVRTYHNKWVPETGGTL